jgi:TrmH family RNA methyltransferase
VSGVFFAGTQHLWRPTLATASSSLGWDDDPFRFHAHTIEHMLSASSRARLTVVLVGARNPSNIGAAARAMQDFGFSDLRVVNDYAAPFEAAQLEATQSEVIPLEAKSAVAAGEVMRNARLFTNLAEAIADCTLIVGTTAIGGRELTQSVEPIQQTAPKIITTLTPGDARVALLFGSEKTGLTKEQLSHCTLLTTIPMFAPGAAADGTLTRHLSMNLGQSVAVCLYELSREGFEGAKELPVLHEAVTTADDRERLTQLLLDVMHATDYSRRYPSNSSEILVRQLAQQLGATHREAMTWMGFLRQILWRERDPK